MICHFQTRLYPLLIQFTVVLFSAFISVDISAQASKPNIIWLSCEDIGPMLSCYGAKGVKTPNLDKLAKEGIMYTNAYATVGVCAPSRSSIITGMYPISIGTHNMRTGPHYSFKKPEDEVYKVETDVRDWRGRNVPEYSAVIPSDVKLFTYFLREKGYYCTNNAKCDYQFNCPLTAWDEVGNKASYKNRPKNASFFAVYNFNITHESQIWMNKDHKMTADTSEISIPKYYPDMPIVRNDVGRAYSNVEELDKEIGVFLEDLEKQGLLSNTIIFFWSDHGGPLLRQKRAVGNSGLHVPLIVRYPDLKNAGTKVDQIVSLMDLGPTVLSLAGIPSPAYMHGKAFLGNYKSKDIKKYAFGSADRFDESRDMARSVLDGRFVYIRNYHPELPLIYRNKYREQIPMTAKLITLNESDALTGPVKEMFSPSKEMEELYDLSNDPDEIHNLASDIQHQSKLMELRKALSEWQLEVGDLGFVDEQDLVQMMWPGLEQPITAQVIFSHKNNRLNLHSDTPGAAICYQKNNDIGTDLWNLYFAPILIDKSDKIEARAVRIGFKTSEATRFSLSEK